MLLRLLLFLSGAGTLFAAPLNNWSQTQEKSGTLEIFSRWDAGGNGNKALDNLIQFDINNFSSRKDWKSRYSVSLGKHHFRTECVSSNGSSFHYEMKIIPVSARELRLDAAVKTGKPYPRSGLTLTLSKASLGECVRLTGISPAGKAFVKEVRYEPENVTRFWHYDGRKELCSKIEIPLNQGMLILSGFEASVIVSKSIDMVIHMEKWDSSKEYDRLGLTEETVTILGVKVPYQTMPVRPGRNLAIIIEVAARNLSLKRMGYSAAHELDRRLNELIAQNSGNHT